MVISIWYFKLESTGKYVQEEYPSKHSKDHFKDKGKDKTKTTTKKKVIHCNHCEEVEQDEESCWKLHP